MTQLALPLYGPNKAPPPNPNAWMFNRDGSPKRLLWCSDGARQGGPCPYAAGEVPLGVCCKDLSTDVAPVTVEAKPYDPATAAIPY